LPEELLRLALGCKFKEAVAQVQPAIPPERQGRHQVRVQCSKGQMAEQVEQEQDLVEETHLKELLAEVVAADSLRPQQLDLLVGTEELPLDLGCLEELLREE